MKKFKLLSLLIVLCSFISCSKKEKLSVNTELEITDYANRTVKLEKPAEKIVVMADNSLYVLKQLDAIDKVIALDSKTISYLNDSILAKTNPELKNLPDVGKTKNPNYEYMLSLTPDLIIFKGNKENSEVIQEKTGIPVVAVASLNGYDFNFYSLLGKLTGTEEKARKIIELLESKKKNLEDKLSKIPDNEKKSAYIVVQNSKKNLFKTIKNNQSLELANIKNVASDANKVDEWGFAEISKEEILKLTPDFVFIDYPISEKSIQKNEIVEDSNFQFMDAVKNNEIYLTHSFSTPKDYAFVISEAYYYANLAYPNHIDENEYKSAINEIFEVTYGIKNYYDDWKKSLQ